VNEGCTKGSESTRKEATGRFSGETARAKKNGCLKRVTEKRGERLKEKGVTPGKKNRGKGTAAPELARKGKGAER